MASQWMGTCAEEINHMAGEEINVIEGPGFLFL
jgi:hypothetical protein